jgi:hypothetical protein
LDDASLDGDGDGYSNLEEFQAGSDPQDPDSTPATVNAPGGGFSCSGRERAGAAPFAAALLAIALCALGGAGRRARPAFAGRRRPVWRNEREGAGSRLGK